MSVSTVTDCTPRVWVGCLACYNEGRLVGEWYDAIDAGDVEPEELHGRATSHDELWCFDHENMPVRGELSPTAATEWAEVLQQIADDERDAFAAYVDNQHGASTPEELQDFADSFSDHYLGEWDSVRDYCENFADDTGMLDGVPEDIASYFDWDAYARDVALESTVLDAPGGRVFMFAG